MKWQYLLLFIFLCFSVSAQIPHSLLVEEEEYATETEHTGTVCKHTSPLLQGAISTPTNYVPQSFDVLHYDVKLAILEPPKPLFNGLCEITFRWVQQPDAFIFHLRSLIVDTVYYNGKPIAVTTPEPVTSPTYHYRVEAPIGATMGDTVKLHVLYHGAATGEGGSLNWGGVQTDGKSVYALGVGFSNNYVSATQHWMPCYDHPSDKATFRGDFATTYPYSVASNGILEVIPGNFTSHYIWTMKDPAATYLMTFACDTYERLLMNGASKPIELWARAADTAATKRSFTHLPRMISTFEKIFSPYPFEKVGYCNTEKGSMEHQTMVCFAAAVSRSGDTVNTTGAHELGHQWFGDLITPYDFRDAWLNESFATYCESLWLGELRGSTGYLNGMQGQLNNYFSYAASEGVVSIYNFDRKPPSSNYPRAIYEKGSVVLGMLRYCMGDTDFFAAIKDYVERYKYANATTDSLQAIITAHARDKEKIKPFFDEWIRGKGWARLEVQTLKQYVNNRWQSVMTVTQVQNAAYPVFSVLPVEFTFKDKQGAVIHKVVMITQKTQTLTLDSLNDYIEITVNRGPTLRSLVQLSKTPTITAVETGESQNLSIAPNPADAVLWIQPHDNIGDIVLRLYNVVGEKVAERTATYNGANRIPLAIDHLANGSYILFVESSAGIQTARCAIVR